MKDFRENVFFSIKLTPEQGLTSILPRLETAAKLGADIVRLSAPYAADCRTAIAPEYGEMADFEAVIAAARGLDLAVMLDFPLAALPVQDETYVKAESNPAAAERAYYCFRPGSELPQKRGEPLQLPPNNWTTLSGGSAWRRAADGEYSLSLFSPGTRDLNWSEPRLRQYVAKLLHFWLEKGVFGFFLCDVDRMAKDMEFPDSARGRREGCFPQEYTVCRPENHEYLRELRQRLFSRKRGLLGGCGRFITPQGIGEYAAPDSAELDFICRAANGRTAPLPPREFKAELLEWMKGVQESGGWLAGTVSSADAQRQSGGFAAGGAQHAAQKKAFAILNLTIRAMPCISDGEEAGIENFLFHLIALRAKYPVLSFGDFLPCCEADRHTVVFLRQYQGVRILVAVNITDRPVTVDISGAGVVNGVLLLGTHRIIGLEQKLYMQPYEGRIYLIK